MAKVITDTQQESKYVERMKSDLGKPALFGQAETRFLKLDEFISLCKDK